MATQSLHFLEAHGVVADNASVRRVGARILYRSRHAYQHAAAIAQPDERCHVRRGGAPVGAENAARRRRDAAGARRVGVSRGGVAAAERKRSAGLVEKLELADGLRRPQPTRSDQAIINRRETE